MKNLKRTPEMQKAINEAADAIFNHFGEVISFADTLQTMNEAQVQLMELMEINRRVAACSDFHMESVPTDDINTFVYEVNEAYRLLKPFAKLIGQVYGNEN
jgi:hypothetical protein